jgi:hypothetical protein
MDSRITGSRAAAGAGLISLFLAVLMVAGLYVGGEWFVTQQIRSELAGILQQDSSAQIEIESVGMDGWLFSGRRAGTAVVVLPSDERVPVEFSMIGNPVTGMTLEVKGEERLKLRLRELFGNFLRP